MKSDDFKTPQFAIFVYYVRNAYILAYSMKNSTHIVFIIKNGGMNFQPPPGLDAHLQGLS